MKKMAEKREKFYTVSARLVFSTSLAIVIVTLILGASVVINKGPIVPILGAVGTKTNTGYVVSTTIGNSSEFPVINAVCFGNSYFSCQYAAFNYTTGVLTVAISQNSGYNWTSVTVRFVNANTSYSNGVPILSWTPPQAVNVTGGLLNNTVKYINVPITSGPLAIGSNITGSIWAKYQLNVGGKVSYANMSSAIIVIKR
jgi:hypothetical protein